MKTVKKPWGIEKVLYRHGKACVKKLVIKPGHRTSLQVHEKTPETWMVIQGHPTIELHGDRDVYEPGASFSVGDGVPHRIAAIFDVVVILEVKFGSDDDIKRIEDDYGR